MRSNYFRLSIRKAPKSVDFRAFGADSQIRTGTAHNADALFTVMRSPLRSNGGRQFENYENKKDRSPRRATDLFGADSQIRTGDLILTKDALYLLSYISKLYAP